MRQPRSSCARRGITSRTGRSVIMFTSVCALCLAASITGAEPPVYVPEPPLELNRLETVPASDRPCSASNTVVLREGPGPWCRPPQPLLYVDTIGAARWYTQQNAALVRQPYDYLVRFDYPWHREYRCPKCSGYGSPTDSAYRSPATLAPLAPSGDTPTGGKVVCRASAIRRVD